MYVKVSCSQVATGAALIRTHSTLGTAYESILKEEPILLLSLSLSFSNLEKVPI